MAHLLRTKLRHEVSKVHGNSLENRLADQCEDGN